MNNKIFCPWCGTEMERNWLVKAYANHDERDAWYECCFCGAQSPTVTGKNAETAFELARICALRRYTPPLKPMTFEAVMRASQTEEVVWVENAKYTFTSEYAAPQHEDLYDGDWRIRLWYPGRDGDEKRYKNNYGKTWRCWERKPTDEERRAAEWET